MFQTTLSFVVHDRNPMVLPNVLLADDNDDFMGSCNMRLTKVKHYLRCTGLFLTLGRPKGLLEII